MANQPKKYKKFVATAATATLVASAIVPVASAKSFNDVADNNDHKANIDKISDLGYMGTGDNFNPGGNLTRGQVAIILANWAKDAAGKEVPADYKTAQRFEDVELTADDKLLQSAALVFDNEIFSGSNGNLLPANDITRLQMALVLNKAYKAIYGVTLVELAGDTSDVVIGDLDKIPAEHQGVVKALKKLGITAPANFDPAGKVTRGQFATFFIKTIEAEGAEVQVNSVTAVGAKKIEVKFNTAVDTSKAEFTLKKGSVNTNIEKFSFSDDKKSVVIETTTKLTKGDYTVSVAGLAKEALTGTVTVADEKVSGIEVLSTTAPMNAASFTTDSKTFGAGESAFVNYKVVNQYGETLTNQNITWTQSTGGYVVDDQANGKLTITNTKNTGTDFLPGTKIFLTGVHAASGTVVNAEFVIGLESKADQVTFKGVYNTNSKKIEALPAGFTEDRYVLLFEVNDQYGNKLPLASHSDLVFTSSNPLFVGNGFATATDVEVDGVTYEAVEIDRGSAPEKGGEVTIQAISKLTGKTATYKINADAKATVKTLTISAPTDIVAEGEKVEIPFAAADQYGNAITKFDDLNGKVTLSANVGTLQFEKQNDGSAKLYFTAALNSGATATTDAPVYLTSLVTDGGSFSSLMVNVKDQAQPTAILGLDSDVSTFVAKGNLVKFKGQDLRVQDQYGRVMSDSKFNTWLNTGSNSVIITSEKPGTDSSAFTVAIDSGSDAATNVLASSTEEVKVTARTAADSKTAERLVFALSTDGINAISSSSKSITFTKVAQSEYASYEVADLGTMYHNSTTGNTDVSTAHAKTVKVYGVKADGTKVLLPATDYTVSLSTGNLSYSNVTSKISEVGAGYADSDFQDASGNYKDAKVQVLVTVNDANGAAAAILEKELLVSNKAPKVETVTLLSNKVTDGKAIISSGTIFAGTFTSYIDEVNDQYGVAKSETPTVTITKLTKVSGSNLTVSNNGTTSTSITGAAMGDKFTATYKFASGVSVSIDFTVGLDTVAPVINSAVTATEYDLDGDGTIEADEQTLNLLVVTFSEGVTDETGAALTAGDFVFTDDSADGVTISAVNHTAGSATAVLTLSAASEATADTINVSNGKVKDAAGNVADHTATAVTVVAP